MVAWGYCLWRGWGEGGESAIVVGGLAVSAVARVARVGLSEHLSLTPIREGGEGGGMWGAVSGADGARGPRVALSDLTSLTGPGESGEMPVAKMCVAKKRSRRFRTPVLPRETS